MAKSVWQYTTDGGVLVKVLLDDKKAATGGFVRPAAGNTSPVIPGFSKRMRGVYAEGSTGSNYFFPMATQDIAAYAANSSTVIGYRGQQFDTISRKGERIYYGSLQEEGENPLLQDNADPA